MLRIIFIEDTQIMNFIFLCEISDMKNLDRQMEMAVTLCIRLVYFIQTTYNNHSNVSCPEIYCILRYVVHY